MRPAPEVDDLTKSRSDTELLLASEAGDRHAFGLLFDRHSRVVFAAALAIVQRRPDAEELLSDAFFLLWRKRASIELAGDSLLPWLITTVRYLAMNRRRATRFSVALSEEIDSGASPSAEHAAELRLLAQQVEALIRKLSPLDQQIVQLCLVESLGYERAAKDLGITRGAVRNRLSRAKKQLRTELDPEGQYS
ncbi:RNA polymerase sigma factor [Diaminobutyricibacter tongyongensis]|uniref:RNA polymerase sigma factor n=1 Tax=Leifsonia tongyongensis TaxID=1268043 RepID=A0A6L9Y2A8_9MICO|nr:RNA polymerase sigma factor [Diaminobutyricibacter tongyongensis]NEN07810.1 RNA polymerase sigma factor [Diaminobutyricibacter tongyongensis]